MQKQITKNKEKNIKYDKKNTKKKNNKQEKKLNTKLLPIIIILFMLLMIFLIYQKFFKPQDLESLRAQQIDTIFSSVNKTNMVSVSKYIVYGTHFNIEGSLTIPVVSGISVDNVKLILKNLNNEESILNADFNYKKSTGIINFSTIDEINSGIDLENLKDSKYYLFLKVSYSNSDVIYYSLENKSEYSDITYYTITKNNRNNKIDIKFDDYNQTPFMCIDVAKSILPDDVYDIVIDPGHGGTDSGAVSDNYTESSIVLNCALDLKSNLENLGLKVLLTRDGSELKTEDMVYNIYDENGRVTITNKSKAKIMLSLHLNSNKDSVESGGVEVYAPSKCNLDFAKLLANNIVNTANSKYSNLNSYKKYDGVYVKNFTNGDISGFKAKAKKSGYEPYNLTTDTPYLYMIREIGGICTNAFVDGRNTSYSANQFINSNVGVEGYLIELGYMVIDEDLQNIVNNTSLYAKAISNSIDIFYLK